MAGSLHKYTVVEAQNAALGQAGATIIADTNVHTATDLTFVAITFLTDSTFTTLTPQDTYWYGSGAGASAIETQDTGSADTTASVTFPKGITIYGRWSVIDLATGSCIAYMGA